MQDRRGIIADYTMGMLYFLKQFVYNAVPLHELIDMYVFEFNIYHLNGCDCNVEVRCLN